MRVLIIDDGLIRRWGVARLATFRALCNAAIRNNYRSYEFSDRDMKHFLSYVGIRPLGEYLTNQALIKVARNFRPDAIILGHCEIIAEETLLRIKELFPHIRMAHFNVDNPQHWNGRKQINQRMKSCDYFFITTGGEAIHEYRKPGKVISWMPNPCDPAMDILDNSKRRDGFERDVFLAAALDPATPRYEFVRRVRSRLLENTKTKAEFFGMFGVPSRFAFDYEELLRTSKMALNINRWDGQFKWSSSDRIAHLMGNGLLTFQSDNNGMQHFFTENETVFYHDVDDLVEKVEYYAEHDDERMAIASAGRAAYHRMFSGQRVLKFMLETMFDEKYSEDYEWLDEVYRG